jgi:hypothetical protein
MILFAKMFYPYITPLPYKQLKVHLPAGFKATLFPRKTEGMLAFFGSPESEFQTISILVGQGGFLFFFPSFLPDKTLPFSFSPLAFSPSLGSISDDMFCVTHCFLCLSLSLSPLLLDPYVHDCNANSQSSLH